MAASRFIRKGNPTGKTSLVGHITRGLVRTAPVAKRSIHGADAAFCSRKSTLHLAIKPAEQLTLTPESTLYFSVGNAIHTAIEEALRKAGVLIANELRLEHGLVRGFIDDIVVSDETGGLKIIDVKTCGQIPSKIKVGQEEQLLAYALLTGITEASILYVSRNIADYNGLKMAEVRADITPARMRQIARTVAESLVFAQRRIVPGKPDYRVSRETCGWCPFKDNGCWSDKEGTPELIPGWKYRNGSDFELDVAVEAKNLFGGRVTAFKKLSEQLKDNPKFKAWKESHADKS